MMDFLRRLAPPLETDAMRAVAVLPSRFAGESPLRSTFAHTRAARQLDEDEASISPDSASPAESSSIPLDPPCSVKNPFGDTPRRTSSASPDAPVPLAVPASTHGLEDLNEATSQARVVLPLSEASRTRRTREPRDDSQFPEATTRHPEPKGLAAAPPAPRSQQNTAAPPARTRVALPLSQAILAQRTLQSRDDTQVVHVTIGRIEVVANTASAPAPRRSPAPRQATVTLADYLRGSHGGRQ